MARKFWCNGNSDSGNNLSLVKWDKLCKPEEVGRLGFRKHEDTISALLAKIGWHVATKKNVLWVRLLRKKYCSKVKFLEDGMSSKDSIAWRDILSTKGLVVFYHRF